MGVKLITPGTLRFSPNGPPPRRGRPPLNGERAMTPAEKAERLRETRKRRRSKKILLPIPPELLPGGLVAQLRKDTFVRRLIDVSFPQLSIIARAYSKKLRDRGLVELPRVHENGDFERLVGTAIDYRIRAYFRRHVHHSETVEWGIRFFQRQSRRGNDLDRLIQSFERFVKKVKPERRKLNLRAEDRLCRYCIIIAYLERNGRVPHSALEDLQSIVCPDIEKTLQSVDADAVSDVIELSRRFHHRYTAIIRKSGKVVIGGELAGSPDVGGADFDLLVGDCLIDFKATRLAKITTLHLRQVIGYWLLDYEDKLKIRSIAIVLLRHGHAELFDIDRDLLPTATPSQLRANFRDALKRIAKSRSNARSIRSQFDSSKKPMRDIGDRAKKAL